MSFENKAPLAESGAETGAETEPATGAPTGELSVCLDADLLGGDLAREAFWAALRDDWRVIRHAPAVLSGHSRAAAGLLEAGPGPEAETLPYRRAALDRIAAARADGRRVILDVPVRGALGEAVADHLGLFDAVVPTTAPGPKPPRPAPGAGLADAVAILRAMRPHQWVKNVLVFLPMIAGHAFTLPAFLWSLLAFTAFGLVASAVYVLNDLVDLPADRRHPTKKNRPFASGALSLAAGTWLFPMLLLAGLGLSAFGGGALFGVMGLYAATTTAYSLKLKGSLGTDILALAVLYTLRIIAGAAATGIAPSLWLLSFSVFLFLSLAAVKRLSELVHIEAEGAHRRAKGRAYTVEDRPVVAMIATSAGFLSVLVLALYIDSPEVRAQYTHPEILWGLGLGLLYWVSRTVLLAHRGQVDQDPVVFALTDRASQITGLLFVLVFITAILG